MFQEAKKRRQLNGQGASFPDLTGDAETRPPGTIYQNLSQTSQVILAGQDGVVPPAGQ